MLRKIWTKFELIVNKIIEIILNIFVKIYQKTIPQKYQKEINNLFTSLGSRCKKFFSKFKIKISLPKKIPKFSFKNLLLPLKNFRVTISKFILFTKNIDFKALDFRKLLIDKLKVIKKIIQPFLNKIIHFFASLTPNTILIIIVFTSFFILLILGLIKSGRTIYMGVLSNKDGQNIGQDDLAPKYRESYFKRILPAKQVDIYEVTMPIYVESANSVRTLLIDITLLTSNRNTRQFIDGNSGLVKDRLNNTVHPIIPDFPLTREGKTIIKEKVIFEINELLKEQKIEGEIQDVYFQMIIVA